MGSGTTRLGLCRFSPLCKVYLLTVPNLGHSGLLYLQNQQLRRSVSGSSMAVLVDSVLAHQSGFGGGQALFISQVSRLGRGSAHAVTNVSRPRTHGQPGQRTARTVERVLDSNFHARQRLDRLLKRRFLTGFLSIGSW